MITQERALETLERFDIDEEQLAEWEAELSLEIAVDKFGNKLYSPLHINLFKNIKKHIALGRSLSEIKRMIVLPSKEKCSVQADCTIIQDIPEPQEREIEEQDTSLPDTAMGDGSLDFMDSVQDKFFASTTAIYPFWDEASPAETERNTLEIEQEETNAAQTETQTQEIKRSLVRRSPLKERLLKELQPFSSEERPKQEVDLLGKECLPDNPASSLKTAPGRVARGNFKRFASPPTSITPSSLVMQPGSNAGLVMLIDRLMQEKDELRMELVHSEKQNAHLFQANGMFQRRVKELVEEVENLQAQIQMNENLKLIDIKSRLQKQLIEAEQRQAEAEKRLLKLNSKLQQLQASLASKISPNVLVGNWLEEADQLEVAFDNFGINIESRRNRMFKITQPPERFFGHTAIIETTYDYQSNTLWKRSETLVLTIIHENRLEGELMIEYTLDGTPVAKANYRVRCYRNGVKAD